jgi:8-oxo-dGTP pyrophosphatase MutT (NUDIX family)
VHKIFAKDKCVYLIDDKSSFVEKKDASLVNHTGKQQLLKEYEAFIQQEQFKHLYIYSPNLSQLWKEYICLFQAMPAAGGVVKNSKSELLLIFRHERWDLPKGKIEKGEPVDHAAIREVQEECGIIEIEIVKELPVTHHTYLLNDKHIIKKTSWFEMRYTGPDGKLIPQLEESITDVRWMDIGAVRKAMENTYPLIREVLGSYLQ